MPDLTISVVIPSYNRAMLLPLTLDAVLAQSAAPDEIIVVDDGSIDGTPELVRQYGGRIRCVVIANSGDLVARNTGLREAGCRLVAFCDSDDLWRPDFLASMRELWRAAPQLQAAYSDFVLVRDGVWETQAKFVAAPAAFWRGWQPLAEGAEAGVFTVAPVEQLIGFQPFFPSCLVVDRAAFLAVGGWDEGVSRMLGCDFATTLRIAEHLRLGVIRRPLVGVRKHAGNFSADVQKMNLGDAKVLEFVLASRPSLRPLAPLIEASVRRRRLEALDTAFARGDFDSVRRIAGLLPRLSGKARVKRLVAGLPEPARRLVATALSHGAVGSTAAGAGV